MMLSNISALDASPAKGSMSINDISSVFTSILAKEWSLTCIREFGNPLSDPI